MMKSKLRWETGLLNTSHVAWLLVQPKTCPRKKSWHLAHRRWGNTFSFNFSSPTSTSDPESDILLREIGKSDEFLVLRKWTHESWNLIQIDQIAKERTKQLRAETGPNRTHFSFTGLYEIKFFEGKNEETLVAKLFKSNLNSRSLNYSLLLRSDSVFVGFSLRYFAVVALLNFVCYLHHGNLCKHALNLSKGIDDGNGKLVLGGCDTIFWSFSYPYRSPFFLLICAVWILQHIKLVRRTYWCRLFIRLAIITGRGRWRYSASATLPLQW